MATILKREQLSPSVVRLRLEAPRIAKKRQAGQFIIIRPTATSERIPLTIADADAIEGWVEIVFQVVGEGTKELSSLKVGESVSDFAGPLGKPTHIEKFGRVLCVGGGVGVAPLYPIARALAQAGNEVVGIIGARHSDLVLLDKEMRSFCAAVYVVTDDGSAGEKGLVTDVIRRLLADGTVFNFAAVIGPVPMMRASSELLVAAKIQTIASLNPIMIDGTGMCGGCRVTVHGKTRFACVEGPEFDAAGIEWTELSRRLASYRDFERQSYEGHHCRLQQTTEGTT